MCNCKKILLTLSFLAGLFHFAPILALNDGLARVQAELISDYADVRHLDADALVALPPGSALLFDVREADEFSVSHLPGAIRVSPDISAGEFNQRYADLLIGKQAVFYCSVGRRSSQLAALLQRDLIAAGSSAVFNLSGGIFNWHNQGRALSDASGRSDFIHPYSRYWGRLLERREQIRYRAQ